MRRIRSQNTLPELTVRRLVYSLGYRYRLHAKELPGKPDIVFRQRRKALFVHGCFWHMHSCKEAHIPKSNQSYWRLKLERNRIRDQHHLESLDHMGWKVLVIWECEINKPRTLANRIRKFLD